MYIENRVLGIDGEIQGTNNFIAKALKKSMKYHKIKYELNKMAGIHIKHGPWVISERFK